MAKKIDTVNSLISSVMTPSPRYVLSTDFAVDALVMMIENRFRHLPVMDEERTIVGVLDIDRKSVV